MIYTVALEIYESEVVTADSIEEAKELAIQAVADRYDITEDRITVDVVKESK